MTVSAPDYVLSFSPSFSMYKVFTELVGGEFIGVYGDDFKFNVEDLIKSVKENNPKLTLICSPNNPTGQFLNLDDVKKVIEATSGLVLLDLAYIDFSDTDYTNIALDYDNVIAFRTFSKAMSLPSIRCGYAISKEFNIDMIDVCVIGCDAIIKVATIQATKKFFSIDSQIIDFDILVVKIDAAFISDAKCSA